MDINEEAILVKIRLNILVELLSNLACIQYIIFSNLYPESGPPEQRFLCLSQSVLDK
jgi:hypothetical protein